MQDRHHMGLLEGLFYLVLLIGLLSWVWEKIKTKIIADFRSSQVLADMKKLSAHCGQGRR